MASPGRFDYAFIAKIDASQKVVFQNLIGQNYEYGPDEPTSVFTTAAGGFVVIGSGGFGKKDVYILQLNSEGDVSGCERFYRVQFDSSSSENLSPVKIAAVNITESNHLSLNSFDFELSSTTTNHELTTVCE